MIFLGNQTPDQISSRLNIELSDEHKEMLKDTWQQNVSKDLEPGKWHCYDLPFLFMCSDKDTAKKWVDIFSSYDLSKAERFQISYEREK